MRTLNITSLAWLAGTALALSAGVASAQIEQFVVTGDAALRTKEKNEISLDTARRIAEHCETAVREKGEAAAISVLNQFGEQDKYSFCAWMGFAGRASSKPRS